MNPVKERNAITMLERAESTDERRKVITAVYRKGIGLERPCSQCVTYEYCVGLNGDVEAVLLQPCAGHRSELSLPERVVLWWDQMDFGTGNLKPEECSLGLAIMSVNALRYALKFPEHVPVNGAAEVLHEMLGQAGEEALLHSCTNIGSCCVMIRNSLIGHGMHAFTPDVWDNFFAACAELTVGPLASPAHCSAHLIAAAVAWNDSMPTI